MEKKPLTPLIGGIILSLISIVLFLAFYFTGLSFKDTPVKWLPVLVFVVLIIIFITKWANDNNNNVTFGQCFGYGFKTVAIFSLIMFVFILIFIFAFPDYKTQIMDMTRIKMNEKPELTADQKDQAMTIMNKFFMISALGGSLFLNLFMGTISALIGAAVAKKNPVTPFDQPMM